MKLCDLIRCNQVFQNNSNNAQHPVEEQMMATLKRLSCFGNGASVGMLARFFQIGKGTVKLYINHCIIATIAIQGPFLSWPNAEACQELSDEYEDQGFKVCVG
ncbi:hypothetical protein VP01_10224g1, partial [Puccinia sorghi]